MNIKSDIGAKTILYPTPVLIAATYDSEGKVNAMNAAWGGICCSDPPCITVSLRKMRHSYSSLMEHRACKIAHIADTPVSKVTRTFLYPPLDEMCDWI